MWSLAVYQIKVFAKSTQYYLFLNLSFKYDYTNVTTSFDKQYE